MKATAGILRLSASDLSNHLACNHLTTLDLAVATGSLALPKWNSPDAWVLQQRGIAHEAAYIQHLQSQGFSITNLQDAGGEKTAFEMTCAAMQSGADVIVQAVLAQGGNWFGRADVLRKVTLPSKLGDWSYEVYDCKLTLETKAGTILQLSLYSDLLADLQGVWAEYMYVVPPSEAFVAESYRILDFAAYYRYVKRRLQNGVENRQKSGQSYPEPTEHCPVCRWWGECQKVRRRDDHLSLVAGINWLQRKQLAFWDLTTVKGLSVLPLPLQRRPERGLRARPRTGAATGSQPQPGQAGCFPVMAPSRLRSVSFCAVSLVLNNVVNGKVKVQPTCLFFRHRVEGPTRLLDWSDGALMALHFALRNREDDGHDARVYVLEPYRLVKELEGLPDEKQAREAWKGHVAKHPSYDLNEDEWEECYLPADKERRKEVNLPQPPLALEFPLITRRIAAQRSRFIVFGTEPCWLFEQFNKSDPQIKAIVIAAGSRAKIRQEIRDCGVTESVIYPDLDGLGREMRQLWEDRKSGSRRKPAG